MPAIRNAAAALTLAILAAALAAPAPARAEGTDAAGWKEFGPVKPTLDVGLVVADGEKSVAFYSGLLGFKRLPGELPIPGAKMIRLQAGTTTVKLLVMDEPPPTHPGGIQKGIGIRLFTVFMGGLDDLAARAGEHGFKKPSLMGAKGSRLVFINDPDGNQVELIEREDATEPRVVLGLTVGDPGASREFYGGVLGMEEKDSGPLFGTSGPTKYNFATDALAIKFWTFGADKPRHTGPFLDAVGLRYFTFMVRDVDAAHEILKARGAKITMEPTDLPPFARYMFVEDPDGNAIEFAQVGARSRRKSAE